MFFDVPLEPPMTPDTPVRKPDCDQLLRREGDFVSWVFADRTGPEIVWYLNPHTLAHLRAGHIVTGRGDRVVADGGLMARALKQGLGGLCRSLHFDFSGLAKVVFSQMRDRGARLAVVGGRPGEAVVFRQIIEQRFPGLEVVFAEDGYFPVTHAGALIGRIAKAKPDVLLVSMGSPRQEIFAQDIAKHTGHAMAVITCGGFVGQTATRRASYYPDLIVRLNLRWMYRLHREPRLFARLMRYYLPYMLRRVVLGPDLPFNGRDRGSDLLG